MEKQSRIFVAGHRGLVGLAICRGLEQRGYSNLILRTHAELDLTDRQAVRSFFDEQKPEYVFLAAAKVGGILANDTYPADFIRENLEIQTHVIDASYRSGVDRLLFLGSSCIYPNSLRNRSKRNIYSVVRLSRPIERMPWRRSREWRCVGLTTGNSERTI